MSKKRDSFCIMPFMHLHNMSNGLMKMCCMTENPIVDDFGKTLFIGNQSISEVWNNNFLKTVRNRMLQGEEIPLCTNCYRIEDSGGKSLRNEYNENYKDKFISFVDEAIQNNGEIKTFPPFIELRTGNTCNSACRMCNTNDSSLVYKENTEIHNTLRANSVFDGQTIGLGYNMMGDPERIIFSPFNEKLSSRVMNLDKHFDEIIENIEKIKIITLSGGEPFLLEKTIHLLEVLGKKNPDVVLYVNTNGSVLSDRLVTALEKIGEVRICVSIDGYGSVQEYIRYPLSWNKIEKNIYKIKALTRKNFYLNFNVTVQALNILNLAPLLTMLVRDFSGQHTNLSFLNSPEHFSIQNLPLDVKEHAAKINENLSKEIREIKTGLGYYTNNKNRLADRLLELNSFMMSEKNPNPEIFEKFKANIKIYDHYRKQDIKNYIPDWIPFL